MLVFPLKTL